MNLLTKNYFLKRSDLAESFIILEFMLKQILMNI
jgi:hypothetical protein